MIGYIFNCGNMIPPDSEAALKSPFPTAMPCPTVRCSREKSMKVRIAVSLIALAALAVAPGIAAASNASSHQILAEATTPLEVPPAPVGGDTSSTGQQAPATTPAPAPAPPEASPAPGPSEDGTGPDDSVDPNVGEELSLGEIPTIETMELTPDIAKRALDSYLLAKEKYADTDLDQYEDLQDFVDKTEDGKNFEADVKAAGFPNVSDWNLSISTLTLAYSSVIDDQTADLEQQIKEIEGDTELAQDMKDKMVKALKALIPSENNKKVIEELLADPVYGPKLKQLDTEEE